MVTAADAKNETLPMLLALVGRAEVRTGSRMTAYETVARRIGASASWVRKFVGRQQVGLEGHVLLNIAGLYRAECERWEAEAEKERALFFALGGETDAMAIRTRQSLGVEAGPHQTAGRPASSLVASLVDEDRQ